MTNEIQETISFLLSKVNADKALFFSDFSEHPLLQKAQAYACEGQAEKFFYVLSYQLSKVVEGLLLTTLPGKEKAYFIFEQYKFLDNHFKRVIERVEGGSCSADKSGAILHRLLQYYLTGQEIVFDTDAEYTFSHPVSVFTTHREIMDFFEALRALYYGRPDQYLSIISGLIKKDCNA